ncbi:MAG: YbaB/EbfC family nucleoid-associated protein [Rickettsiaceae bacterium H1]|nr:YbaB/EbfC family nucleoid-associated protein [Rickettsiaceae bacterium H1]
MDLSGMMKGMQKKMLDMQKAEEEKRSQTKVIGESGGGIVKVTMNGNYDVIDLHISNALKDEDDENDDQCEVLSDLIIAAFKYAKKQVDESNNNSKSDMINNMGLPFKMPF